MEKGFKRHNIPSVFTHLLHEGRSVCSVSLRSTTGYLRAKHCMDNNQPAYQTYRCWTTKRGRKRPIMTESRESEK
eukprot:2085150-Pyramimonas_sp.AAC.1